MKNLTHIWPFFIVENLETSVAFYVNKLGFEVRHIGPDDDPYFAIVGRDDISIMLKVIASDIKPVPNHTRHHWAPWDAYIYAAEPAALFEEYQSLGITFHQSLKVNTDRLLGFEVADADGYILFFGRPES
jgi:catechol 2,3-dioxygenase-like lactoylglutathione lyase family enzyme